MSTDYISFTYAIFENSPLFLPAKSVVHFRPKVDWKGEGYGFDWMRLGDTAIFGDMKPYKDIVSKQYTDATNGILEKGINECKGHFDPTTAESVALYEKLKLEYKPLIILNKKNATTSKLEQYFCSWLSLYPSKVDTFKFKSFEGFMKPTPKEKQIPYKDAKNNESLLEKEEKSTGYSNTKAELRLYVDVIEQPDALEFEFSDKYFNVTPKKITNDLGVGTRFWDGGKTIEVECLKEFSDDEKIDVYAVKKDPITNEDVKKLAGRLYVFANNASKRKKVKALLLEIQTPPILDANYRTGNISGQKEMFEKYLRQALIDVEVDSYVLDLSADPEFIKPAGKFVSGNRIDDDKIRGSNMIGHMEEKLKKQLKAEGKDENMYNGIFKAFYFAEPGTSNGYYDSYTGHVVLYEGKSPETPSHEFLHKFKVSHSFANHECHEYPYLAGFRSDCTYQYDATENLMDYSHHSGNLRYALWHWQWVAANGNAI